MAISFNVSPYWDDFETAGADGLSPKEKYQRILFRPGKAVQARELTQLQTTLQNQISSTGDHVFKEGSVVVPGAVHLHNKIDYVKLDSVHANNDTVAELVGTEFTDGTNKAKVIHAALATGSDPITLWVQYISGTIFADNATITASGSKSAEVKASAATGFGSIVSIEDGIYYIKKHFVVAKAKTIVLSKYTHNVSFDIGLLVTEALVSSGSDASLNDNATGTPNASAPGAHRYSITAVLSTQAVNAATGNFVLIARLEAGLITKNARTSDYNHLADELARRTFDESGNYYVNPFKALVKAHTGGTATKLTLGVEPSKAYVRGYEIQTLATTNVHFDKARTSERVTDKVTEITHNNYIEITSMVNAPDITTFGRISIENSGGTQIGTCRARSVERVSGNGASSASRYRIHIFDVQFETSNTTGMANATQLDALDASGGTFAGAIASHNIGPDSLIYKLPYDRVKTCDTITDGGTPDFNYRFETNRIIAADGVVNSNAAAFTTGVTNEVFGTKASNGNWILINDSDDTVLGGEEVVIADISINGAGTTATISNLPSSANGDTVRLIAPFIRTATHKSKTLSSNTTSAFAAGVTGGYAGTVAGYEKGQALGHADVYELVSVIENVGSANVTEHFDLDKGQRDDYYDLGYIKLKSTSNYTAAVALNVTYKYLSHTAGDFFTVDSYPATVGYENIPKVSGIELRSAVDFRPRVANAGTAFTGTGAIIAVAPSRYTQFETDIQFYLPRIDNVYLDSKGVFGIAPGVPSRYPEASSIPSDSMHLYTLTIPAYTLTPAEVTVKFIDNRRYTMRDIGRIDKRVDQVEYYSVLSFLETEAANKQILDGASNSQRWKSGYLVDGFSNTRMSNSGSAEYKASVDINKRILRPPFGQGNAALSHDATSTTTKTGDLVTLPYTTNTSASNLISQTQYSGQINVNPYDVFNWTGSMALTPTTDEWRDIDRRPEVVINNDNEFDAMMNNLSPQVGTVWGEWSTNWTGSHWQQSGNTNNLIETGTASRTGVQQTIEVQTSRFSIGDRIVEVNFVPFMRTRLVTFSATRMKPATQVYAYFDGTSVADYVSTTAVTYTPLVGVNTVTVHPASGGATTLTTDANGAVSGTFLIPNNSTLNFPTGEKEFKLTQSSSNDDEVTTTSATAMYTAAGLIETRENVIVSTRTPVLQRNSVSDSHADSRTIRSVQINWEDPLAQSILLDKAAFVTSLDLYFTAKDAAIPVQVQIRQMTNGFPTQTVIPFADVTLNPSSVNTDGTATAFTFPSPVFLQDGIEYAFVVLANSNKYTVRYAEIGAEDQNGNRISQQPYNGVMFKSQNASTWTSDQNKDLTFVLKRAVFTTDTKTCVLRNDALPSRALVANPVTTTNSSTNITVAHRDHGMSVSDSVTLAGCAASNGHTTSHLNTTHTITAITRDSYTFVSAGTGNATGIAGGSACQATQHLAWNTLHPVIQQVILPNTTQTWTIQDTAETQNASIGSTATAITVNEDYTPTSPKGIKLAANVNGTSHSIQLNGTFSSTSDYLSPVIDMERCSVITISNRIDNQTGAPLETVATGGNNLAKYVTKTIELNDSSDGIKIYLDINRPNGTFVDVYHKTGETAGTFNTNAWVAATPSSNNGTVAFSDGTTYAETIYDITPTATFTIFAIKIVMRSTGTSSIPKMQALRAIALKV